MSSSPSTSKVPPKNNKRINEPSVVENYRIDGLTWAEFVREDQNLNINSNIQEAFEWSEFFGAEVDTTKYGDAWAHEKYHIKGLIWAESLQEYDNIVENIQEAFDRSEYFGAEALAPESGDAWAYDMYHIEGLTWADFVPPGTNINVYGDLWGTEWERLQVEGLIWPDFVK